MTTSNNQKAFDLSATGAKSALSDVHNFESRGHFINELNLFNVFHQGIPNLIRYDNIQCDKARIWFQENYKTEIIDSLFNKRQFRGSKQPLIDDTFFFLFDDLIVCFDTNCSKLTLLFKKTDNTKVERVIKDLERFKARKSRFKPEISLIIQTINGLETKPLSIHKPKLNIEDNYNDDFLEINKIIVKRLSKKNQKGLVLLHGKPGTGKTSYVRYLISSIKKPIIFLPTNMAKAITTPSLISILIDNPNSIFVIEDAENIIMDREKDGSSPVSALLNISDGLLADCLNVQVICSFNTDLSKIDSALVRKGRLIAKYEFKELSADKAQRLSNKLGFKSTINSPMTVSAIYNQEEKDFAEHKVKRPIGFGTIHSAQVAQN